MGSLKTRGRHRGIQDKALFWRLWHDRNVDLLGIATQLRVSIGTVRKEASRLHLPARQMTRNEVEVAMGRDPTEEEIWGPGGLTEQIRASWTPQHQYDARVRATSITSEEGGRRQLQES